MKWKIVDKSKRGPLRQIARIDSFNGDPAPLIRMRGSFTGPCIGEYFADFIMNIEERRQWDAQIDNVYEIYPIHDLDAAQVAMGFGRYGDCSRLGVGYALTKPNLGISAREQLTLCGIQDFKDGSSIIWGTEMEDWHNYMLPPGKRVTRSKSRIFCTTLTPTSDNTFDVEYVLQLSIGGMIPTWMTGPIVTDAVKNLFRYADKCFKGKGGQLDAFLQKKQDSIEDRHSLLMTP